MNLKKTLILKLRTFCFLKKQYQRRIISPLRMQNYMAISLFIFLLFSIKFFFSNYLLAILLILFSTFYLLTHEKINFNLACTESHGLVEGFYYSQIELLALDSSMNPYELLIIFIGISMIIINYFFLSYNERNYNNNNFKKFAITITKFAIKSPFLFLFFIFFTYSILFLINTVFIFIGLLPVINTTTTSLFIISVFIRLIFFKLLVLVVKVFVFNIWHMNDISINIQSVLISLLIGFLYVHYINCYVNNFLSLCSNVFYQKITNMRFLVNTLFINTSVLTNTIINGIKLNFSNYHKLKSLPIIKILQSFIFFRKPLELLMTYVSYNPKGINQINSSSKFKIPYTEVKVKNNLSELAKTYLNKKTFVPFYVDKQPNLYNVKINLGVNNAKSWIATNKYLLLDAVSKLSCSVNLNVKIKIIDSNYTYEILAKSTTGILKNLSVDFYETKVYSGYKDKNYANDFKNTYPTQDLLMKTRKLMSPLSLTVFSMNSINYDNPFMSSGHNFTSNTNPNSSDTNSLSLDEQVIENNSMEEEFLYNIENSIDHNVNYEQGLFDQYTNNPSSNTTISGTDNLPLDDQEVEMFENLTTLYDKEPVHLPNEQDDLDSSDVIDLTEHQDDLNNSDVIDLTEQQNNLDNSDITDLTEPPNDFTISDVFDLTGNPQDYWYIRAVRPVNYRDTILVDHYRVQGWLTRPTLYFNSDFLINSGKYIYAAEVYNRLYNFLENGNYKNRNWDYNDSSQKGLFELALTEIRFNAICYSNNDRLTNIYIGKQKSFWLCINTAIDRLKRSIDGVIISNGDITVRPLGFYPTDRRRFVVKEAFVSFNVEKLMGENKLRYLYSICTEIHNYICLYTQTNWFSLHLTIDHFRYSNKDAFVNLLDYVIRHINHNYYYNTNNNSKVWGNFTTRKLYKVTDEKLFSPEFLAIFEAFLRDSR